MSISRFIVGMPRSGTTWLCRTLNQHRDVAVFGETMFWGKAFVNPGTSGCYDQEAIESILNVLTKKPFETTVGGPEAGRMRHLKRNDLPALLGGVLKDRHSAKPGALFEALGAAIAKAEGKSQWIEKTPHHLLHIERILSHLPDSRFVVMLREPYGFMLSYKHQPGHERTIESRKRFERRYHPLGCTLVWRNSLISAMRLSEKYPDRIMIVNCDDIRERSSTTLQEVQQFFLLTEDPNLTPIASAINSSFDEQPRPTLTDSDIVWMNLIAGPQIKKFGYTRRTAKQPFLAILRSSLALPFWVLRFAADMRRTSNTSLFQYLRRWVGAGSDQKTTHPDQQP